MSTMGLLFTLIRLSCSDLQNDSHHNLDVTLGVNDISIESDFSQREFQLSNINDVRALGILV